MYSTVHEIITKFLHVAVRVHMIYLHMYATSYIFDDKIITIAFLSLNTQLKYLNACKYNWNNQNQLGVGHDYKTETDAFCSNLSQTLWDEVNLLEWKHLFQTTWYNGGRFGVGEKMDDKVLIALELVLHNAVLGSRRKKEKCSTWWYFQAWDGSVSISSMKSRTCNRRITIEVSLDMGYLVWAVHPASTRAKKFGFAFISSICLAPYSPKSISTACSISIPKWKYCQTVKT